jgi:peptidyl-prolyl cis-trans isomerase B (cyclophilin B)
VDFGQGFFSRIEAPEPGVLAGLAEELEDSDAGPWAKAIEIRRRFDDGDTEGALMAIEELESTWPDHPLASARIPFQEDGEPITLGEHLRARMAAVESWEAQHPALFSNPPLPEDAPRVRLETTAGTIVLGLYTDWAPKHCENFLSRCREGLYDGTVFHRVVRDFMIQGGDPNTIEGDQSTWGQGCESTIEPEIGELRHFRHTLAAARKGADKNSSDCQFYITTADRHDLDLQYTVFGALIEGEETVEEIQSGAVVGETPQDPVRITSATVLE